MGNLLIVFFFTIGFGFLLIFLLQKSAAKKAPTDQAALPTALQGLSFDQFYSQVCDLLEKLGLQLNETHRENEYEADIQAQNTTPLIGGPVIIHLSFYPPEGKVSSVEVMNFAGNLVGDRRGKGIYITTGEFAPEVWILPELPPMELIDGKKLEGLFQKYEILS